jgi:hypothetical protein
MVGRSAQISLARSLACGAMKQGLCPDLRTNCSCWDCGGCLQSRNLVDHDGGFFIFGPVPPDGIEILEDNWPMCRRFRFSLMHKY